MKTLEALRELRARIQAARVTAEMIRDAEERYSSTHVATEITAIELALALERIDGEITALAPRKGGRSWQS